MIMGGYCRQLQQISDLHQRQQWLQSSTFTQHLGGAWWRCVIHGGWAALTMPSLDFDSKLGIHEGDDNEIVHLKTVRCTS